MCIRSGESLDHAMFFRACDEVVGSVLTGHAKASAEYPVRGEAIFCARIVRSYGLEELSLGLE